MTRIGIMRERYAKEVESRPSRFSDQYQAWAERADLWASQQEDDE